MYKPRIVPTRLTVAQVVVSEGMSLAENAEQALTYGIAPAACRHHCNTEPDGECVHGNPSVLVLAGLL